MLQISGLTRRFGGAVAVDDISLDVEAGSITGLIGPNGAGKTTLFNLVAGSLSPTAGRIVLEGIDIARLPAHRRLARGLARTFQIPRPFAALTVLENALVGARGQLGERILPNWLRGGAIARQERDLAARAREILEFLGLSRLESEPAARLSGGQRKLLELARVLMAEPRIVLLDEPAAGVNPTLLRTIMDRLGTLNARGMTFLIVEHNMDLVRELCGQAHVMAGGRLLASGTPAEVTADARVLEAYLGG